MAATKYLDYNGLLYFWTCIKGMFAQPATANPLMDGTAAVGSSSKYAKEDHVHPSDTSKADAATTIAGYGITDAYTKTEIDQKLTSGMHYKGSVATVSQLPASGNEVGDFYNVTATGENYAWDGSAWDLTGSIVDLQAITNAEIDTIVAS